MVFRLFVRLWILLFGLGILSLAVFALLFGVATSVNLPFPFGIVLIGVAVLGILGGLGVMELAVKGS